MMRTDQIEVRHSDIDLRADQFDDREWAKAAPVRISRYWSGEETPAGRHVEVRILWTKESLMVRFVCRQMEPLVVSSSPQLDKKTVGLWDRDVCEIFIAPDLSRPNHYFEFEAAPTGEWLDVAIEVKPSGRESDWKFGSGMTTAARIARERVIIAMRIPWDDWIHKPQRGEQWRVNLFRCVGAGETRGYLAWQPTRTRTPNFHVPEAFGRLTFT
jgi:hypothetical protein